MWIWKAQRSSQPSRGDSSNCQWQCSVWVAAVESLSRVWLFVTPWTVARQASLPFTISQSLLKLMCIESMMPSNHLILCHPLLLPSVFLRIRVFSNESALCIRWPKYWRFSFSISPSSEYSGLISLGLTGLISLLASRGLLNSLTCDPPPFSESATASPALLTSQVYMTSPVLSPLYFLLLCFSVRQTSCDCFGPTERIQDNLPKISLSVTLIPFAKSLHGSC